MHVPFLSHDDYEDAPRRSAGDLHGSIGGVSDPEPDDSRRVVGFRLPPAMSGRFPRTAALSFDGKTWESL